MLKFSKLILVTILVLTGFVNAQNISGSMSGRIIDAQGAAVPAAVITAVEPNKRITVSTRTNEQGEFIFPALQPGSYTLSAEAQGFKKLTRTAIALDANDKLSLGDVSLQVGSLTETVEVAGE